MIDFEPIPAFLLRPMGDEVERTAHAPRVRKPEPWARPRPPRGWPKGMPVPKTITPEAIALARDIDRAEKQKAAARFAALKARRRA